MGLTALCCKNNGIGMWSLLLPQQLLSPGPAQHCPFLRSQGMLQLPLCDYSVLHLARNKKSKGLVTDGKMWLCFSLVAHGRALPGSCRRLLRPGVNHVKETSGESAGVSLAACVCTTVTVTTGCSCRFCRYQG